ncbi:hypothetical protein BLNAU_4862 [Blattamonas nauphoetae]|uniref:Uncharacterized protein n=1 Tax=Blattamonas nauphoetae TaxID=2049346 RepID=A0ABQ9Y9C8_9EUKA|nr:hypothetical protein BLNAU_4862 [Blattamonas nauphoetae]
MAICFGDIVILSSKISDRTVLLSERIGPASFLFDEELFKNDLQFMSHFGRNCWEIIGLSRFSTDTTPSDLTETPDDLFGCRLHYGDKFVLRNLLTRQIFSFLQDFSSSFRRKDEIRGKAELEFLSPSVSQKKGHTIENGDSVVVIDNSTGLLVSYDASTIHTFGSSLSKPQWLPLAGTKTSQWTITTFGLGIWDRYSEYNLNNTSNKDIRRSCSDQIKQEFVSGSIISIGDTQHTTFLSGFSPLCDSYLLNKSNQDSRDSTTSHPEAPQPLFRILPTRPVKIDSIPNEQHQLSKTSIFERGIVMNAITQDFVDLTEMWELDLVSGRFSDYNTFLFDLSKANVRLRWNTPFRVRSLLSGKYLSVSTDSATNLEEKAKYDQQQTVQVPQSVQDPFKSPDQTEPPPTPNTPKEKPKSEDDAENNSSGEIVWSSDQDDIDNTLFVCVPINEYLLTNLVSHSHPFSIVHVATLSRLIRGNLFSIEADEVKKRLQRELDLARIRNEDGSVPLEGSFGHSRASGDGPRSLSHSLSRSRGKSFGSLRSKPSKGSGFSNQFGAQFFRTKEERDNPIEPFSEYLTLSTRCIWGSQKAVGEKERTKEDVKRELMREYTTKEFMEIDEMNSLAREDEKMEEMNEDEKMKLMSQLFRSMTDEETDEDFVITRKGDRASSLVCFILGSSHTVTDLMTELPRKTDQTTEFPLSTIIQLDLVLTMLTNVLFPLVDSKDPVAVLYMVSFIHTFNSLPSPRQDTEFDVVPLTNSQTLQNTIAQAGFLRSCLDILDHLSPSSRLAHAEHPQHLAAVNSLRNTCLFILSALCFKNEYCASIVKRRDLKWLFSTNFVNALVLFHTVFCSNARFTDTISEVYIKEAIAASTQQTENGAQLILNKSRCIVFLNSLCEFRPNQVVLLPLTKFLGVTTFQADFADLQILKTWKKDTGETGPLTILRKALQKEADTVGDEDSFLTQPKKLDEQTEDDDSGTQIRVFVFKSNQNKLAEILKKHRDGTSLFTQQDALLLDATPREDTDKTPTDTDSTPTHSILFESLEGYRGFTRPEFLKSVDSLNFPPSDDQKPFALTKDYVREKDYRTNETGEEFSLERDPEWWMHLALSLRMFTVLTHQARKESVIAARALFPHVTLFAMVFTPEIPGHVRIEAFRLLRVLFLTPHAESITESLKQAGPPVDEKLTKSEKRILRTKKSLFRAIRAVSLIINALLIAQSNSSRKASQNETPDQSHQNQGLASQNGMTDERKKVKALNPNMRFLGQLTLAQQFRFLNQIVLCLHCCLSTQGNNSSESDFFTEPYFREATSVEEYFILRNGKRVQIDEAEAKRIKEKATQMRATERGPVETIVSRPLSGLKQTLSYLVSSPFRLREPLVIIQHYEWYDEVETVLTKRGELKSPLPPAVVRVLCREIKTSARRIREMMKKREAQKTIKTHWHDFLKLKPEETKKKARIGDNSDLIALLDRNLNQPIEPNVKTELASWKPVLEPDDTGIRERLEWAEVKMRSLLLSDHVAEGHLQGLLNFIESLVIHGSASELFDVYERKDAKFAHLIESSSHSHTPTPSPLQHQRSQTFSFHGPQHSAEKFESVSGISITSHHPLDDLLDHRTPPDPVLIKLAECSKQTPPSLQSVQIRPTLVSLVQQLDLVQFLSLATHHPHSKIDDRCRFYRLLLLILNGESLADAEHPASMSRIAAAILLDRLFISLRSNEELIQTSSTVLASALLVRLLRVQAVSAVVTPKQVKMVCLRLGEKLEKEEQNNLIRILVLACGMPSHPLRTNQSTIIKSGVPNIHRILFPPKETKETSGHTSELNELREQENYMWDAAAEFKRIDDTDNCGDDLVLHIVRCLYGIRGETTLPPTEPWHVGEKVLASLCFYHRSTVDRASTELEGQSDLAIRLSSVELLTSLSFGLSPESRFYVNTYLPFPSLVRAISPELRVVLPVSVVKIFHKAIMHGHLAFPLSNLTSSLEAASLHSLTNTLLASYTHSLSALALLSSSKVLEDDPKMKNLRLYQQVDLNHKSLIESIVDTINPNRPGMESPPLNPLIHPMEPQSPNPAIDSMKHQEPDPASPTLNSIATPKAAEISLLFSVRVCGQYLFYLLSECYQPTTQFLLTALRSQLRLTLSIDELKTYLKSSLNTANDTNPTKITLPVLTGSDKKLLTKFQVLNEWDVGFHQVLHRHSPQNKPEIESWLARPVQNEYPLTFSRFMFLFRKDIVFKDVHKGKTELNLLEKRPDPFELMYPTSQDTIKSPIYVFHKSEESFPSRLALALIERLFVPLQTLSTLIVLASDMFVTYDANTNINIPDFLFQIAKTAEPQHTDTSQPTDTNKPKNSSSVIREALFDSESGFSPEAASNPLNSVQNSLNQLKDWPIVLGYNASLFRGMSVLPHTRLAERPPSQSFPRALVRSIRVLLISPFVCLDTTTTSKFYTAISNLRNIRPTITLRPGQTYETFVHHFNQFEENVDLKKTSLCPSYLQDLPIIQNKDRNEKIQNLSTFCTAVGHINSFIRKSHHEKSSKLITLLNSEEEANPPTPTPPTQDTPKPADDQLQVRSDVSQLQSVDAKFFVVHQRSEVRTITDMFPKLGMASVELPFLVNMAVWQQRKAIEKDWREKLGQKSNTLTLTINTVERVLSKDIGDALTQLFHGWAKLQTEFNHETTEFEKSLHRTIPWKPCRDNNRIVCVVLNTYCHVYWSTGSNHLRLHLSRNGLLRQALIHAASTSLDVAAAALQTVSSIVLPPSLHKAELLSTVLRKKASDYPKYEVLPEVETEITLICLSLIVALMERQEWLFLPRFCEQLNELAAEISDPFVFATKIKWKKENNSFHTNTVLKAYIESALSLISHLTSSHNNIAQCVFGGLYTDTPSTRTRSEDDTGDSASVKCAIRLFSAKLRLIHLKYKKYLQLGTSDEQTRVDRKLTTEMKLTTLKASVAAQILQDEMIHPFFPSPEQHFDVIGSIIRLLSSLVPNVRVAHWALNVDVEHVNLLLTTLTNLISGPCLANQQRAIDSGIVSLLSTLLSLKPMIIIDCETNDDQRKINQECLKLDKNILNVCFALIEGPKRIQICELLLNAEIQSLLRKKVRKYEQFWDTWTEEHKPLFMSSEAELEWNVKVSTVRDTELRLMCLDAHLHEVESDAKSGNERLKVYDSLDHRMILEEMGKVEVVRTYASLDDDGERAIGKLVREELESKKNETRATIQESEEEHELMELVFFPIDEHVTTLPSSAHKSISQDCWKVPDPVGRMERFQTLSIGTHKGEKVNQKYDNNSFVQFILNNFVHQSVYITSIVVVIMSLILLIFKDFLTNPLGMEIVLLILIIVQFVLCAYKLIHAIILGNSTTTQKKAASYRIDQLRKNRNWKPKRVGIGTMVRHWLWALNWSIVSAVICLVFSGFAIWKPNFIAFLVIVLIQDIPIMETIITALSLNLQFLLLTLVLVVLLLGLYAVFLSFVYMNRVVIDGVNICDTLAGCFHMIVWSAPGGGSLHDWMTMTNVWDVVISLTFFVIVASVTINLFLAVINDSVGDKQAHMAEVSSRQLNECLICGQGRTDLEMAGIDFQTHVEKEHDVHNYFAFLMTLLANGENPQREVFVTGTEALILCHLRYETQSLTPSYFPMDESFYQNKRNSGDIFEDSEERREVGLSVGERKRDLEMERKKKEAMTALSATRVVKERLAKMNIQLEEIQKRMESMDGHKSGVIIRPITMIRQI